MSIFIHDTFEVDESITLVYDVGCDQKPTFLHVSCKYSHLLIFVFKMSDSKTFPPVALEYDLSDPPPAYSPLIRPSHASISEISITSRLENESQFGDFDDSDELEGKLRTLSTVFDRIIADMTSA